MLQERPKTGVTVVFVSRKDQRANRPRKRRREMSVKVTRVSRNSLNKIKMIHPAEQKKLSDDSNLTKMTTTIPIPFDQYQQENLSDISLQRCFLEMGSISSVHETSSSYPRLSTLTKNNCHPILTTSSNNISFASFDNYDTSINLSKTKPLLQYHKQQLKQKGRQYINPIFEKRSKKQTGTIDVDQTHKRKRRHRNRKICPLCSKCCCFATTLGILLFLVGLAALLVFIFTNKNITTTTTTITTTSSTSATSLTTTSTTSTTSTISTTSATTVSTSTSSTTSETTSSSTSATGSTLTTSTTTITTATTTPMPPCTPSSVGSASTLYSTSSGSGTSYTCFAYEWTAPTTGLVTLAFQLRHAAVYWYLDDVSVYNGATQMLINGDFETGSLSPWVRTTPNGACGGTAGQVSTSSAHSGTYTLRDGSFSCADQISQQFTATAGDVYIVSFWLKSGGLGSGVSALVTLS